MDSEGRDPFISMMTAESKVTLNLSDFAPQSMLHVTEHSIERPKFPAIDFHNHIDGLEPSEVLRIMDACGIEHLVNITMKPGTEGLESLARLHAESPDRFSTIAWMDWRDLLEDGFVKRSIQRLERCVDEGAIGIKIWKDLGLRLRDRDGSIVRIDDSRWDPFFARVVLPRTSRRASSPKMLAKQLELSEAEVRQTLDAQRATADGTADAFGRRASGGGLGEPLYGIRVTGSRLATLGGLAVDAQARVIDASGNAIAGLYAVGGAAAGIDDRGGDAGVAAIDALTGLSLARLAALSLGAVVDEA